MKKGRKYSREEIEVISKSAIGYTLKELMSKELVTVEEKNKMSSKGGFGQLIEMILFGIENNSESEPDFMPAGIELKVTPYKRIKGNKLSAKERLVLNIIDYETEYKNEFKASHFWFKNNKIQLIWYLWEENKNKDDLKITHEKLLELSLSEDIKQIEDDWNYIIKKIREGKAHEISEADTMYLGACTKGANASSVRKQPFSNIPAMQRAFCFKTSYMTQLVRKYIGNYSDVEKVIKRNNKTFNQYIHEVVSMYKNKSQKELKSIFNINSNSKNVNDLILRKMFGVSCNLSSTDEFSKANIIPKTIRIEKNGNIKESMSFPAFKYNEIVKEEWEDSTIKNMFETTKFMFFVFKYEKDDYYFKGIKLWNMPETDIEGDLKLTWQKVVDIIKRGNIVNHIDNRNRKITNFPGMSESRICHIRPHGRNSQDTYPLPVADKLTGKKGFTKQCFWLNNSYIKNIIKEFI